MIQKLDSNLGYQKGKLLNRIRLVSIVAIVLGISLCISVFFNLTSPYPLNTIVGTVDHRSDYENTNSVGEPIVQYFVAIRPISDNGVAGTTSGQVENYLVDKEDFDALNANDIVVAKVSWDGGADIVRILPQEEWIRPECVGQPNLVEASSDRYCAKG